MLGKDPSKNISWEEEEELEKEETDWRERELERE